jgi:hypothetical protein
MQARFSGLILARLQQRSQVAAPADRTLIPRHQWATWGRTVGSRVLRAVCRCFVCLHFMTFPGIKIPVESLFGSAHNRHTFLLLHCHRVH